MVVVDTHCHASLDWYEPIETLLYQMDSNGVDHAVLIQIMGQFDNEYQFACARRYPGRFANVVLVDAERPVGRAPDGGSSADFASYEFSATVQALPGLRIVIEHLRSVSRADSDDAQRAMRRKVFGLSRFPNTFIKVTGLGEFSQRAMPVPGGFPFEGTIPPLLEEAHTAFGPSRMMWGSDFPPVAAREGYAAALHLTQDQFAAKSQADRDQIFGQTALTVFKF